VISRAAGDPDCSSPSLAGCFLLSQVSNPFYPKIKQGALANPTITQNQLLLPFPQYGGISNTGEYSGVSNYSALELKLQKHLPNNGTILGSYTWSKLMTNAEYLDSWLDGIVGLTTGGWQNYNDPNAEYSLSSFDARQRLVVSYLYQLPIGRGQRFLPNSNAVANQLIGGWGLEGITIPSGAMDTARCCPR
jgi:hypothetical protein